MAESRTATANINGITIHCACKLSKDTVPWEGRQADVDGFEVLSLTGLISTRTQKIDLQKKYLLIINKVSMFGARTLYIINEQLFRVRESTRDFGSYYIIFPVTCSTTLLYSTTLAPLPIVALSLIGRSLGCAARLQVLASPPHRSFTYDPI
jgi:hypothetical protein